MSRYTGPKWKISRRLGFSILETGDELKKRPYAPGQQGKNKKKKISEYGKQLQEKQKVRTMYGVTSLDFLAKPKIFLNCLSFTPYIVRTFCFSCNCLPYSEIFFFLFFPC